MAHRRVAVTETTEHGERSDAESDDGPRGRPCPFCETPMQHRHCKYICPAHGVVYDCSDTFW
ncbi:hypothetical protein AUR64_15895 [Haloprofundus marisrubri]|uniref:Small CPxCG-related zinc finger protein n=1 Tax=Haloprofundus marisrubri TaxID=1514971 RepID=A0A0W1R8H5_9EURY|nr:hypothetical protein AUR64_15895 [Haloprofundus marisrubri]